MAKSTKYEFQISVFCSIAAVLGIVHGFFIHSPLLSVISLFPAAIYEVLYVDEPTSGWAKWGLFMLLNIEAGLIFKNISINITQYLVKFTTDLPVMDLRLVIPVLIAYFSYILARKTQGAFTRWIGLLLLACSMAILYVVDINLRMA